MSLNLDAPFRPLDFMGASAGAPAPARQSAQQVKVEVPGDGRYMLNGVKTGVFDAADSIPSPWEIIFQQTDDGSWQFGVNGDSDVYDGINFTTVPVTGLLDDYTNPADAGWKTPAVGFVFLWGTMNEDGVAVDTIEVKNDQNDLASIKRVDSADGKQTQFAFVLGYIWSDSSGGTLQWYVRQEATRHVTLLHVAVSGVICKVPFQM